MPIRSSVSVFRCEVRRAVQGRSTCLFVGAAVALCLVASMTTSEILIMVAGDDPYTLGGAIGFIGNLVDRSDVVGSSARTAFSLTVMWIPMCVVYAVYTAAVEYGTAAHAVSRARGASELFLTGVKTAARCAVICVVYLFMSAVVFSIKMAQCGATFSWDAIGLFVLHGVLIAGLLSAQYCIAYVLQVLIGHAFASSAVTIAIAILILVAYPSSYGSGTVCFACQLSPVYYLMNACALSMRGSEMACAFLYVIAVVAVSVIASSGILYIKEGLQ